MDYTHPEYLISTSDLADLIDAGSGNLRIYDVTVHLVPNPPGYKAVSGLEDFRKAHIPGARFLDLARDFSDTSSGLGFTLPSADFLQTAWRSAGVDNDSRVVFYSSGHMMWATRAWWMLHSCGHAGVSVLNGGLARWQAEGRDCTEVTEPAIQGDFDCHLNPELWADKEKVIAAINDDEVCTINALSPGVYSGEAEMNYGRKGHIENSRNVYYDELLDDGGYRSADELETLFREKGVLDRPAVIAYCGGGISATIDALGLKLIGHEQVAVYDGSMSEWVRDESLPLVTGTE